MPRNMAGSGSSSQIVTCGHLSSSFHSWHWLSFLFIYFCVYSLGKLTRKSSWLWASTHIQLVDTWEIPSETCAVIGKRTGLSGQIALLPALPLAFCVMVSPLLYPLEPRLPQLQWEYPCARAAVMMKWDTAAKVHSTLSLSLSVQIPPSCSPCSAEMVSIKLNFLSTSSALMTQILGWAWTAFS